MKYFLVLGIEYKFYKKPADITIHVGEKLVDSFTLDRDFTCSKDILKHIEQERYKICNQTICLTRADWIENWKQVPSLFKIYELDDNQLHGKLKIKVDNSNSDFTNGFMKNSSSIRFTIPALFKKKLCENKAEKMFEELMKIDDKMCEMFEHLRPLEYKKKYAGKPLGDKKMIQNKRWLLATSFYVTRENDLYEKSGYRDRYCWIGGSFTAEFEIVQREGTKYLGLIEDSRGLYVPRGVTPHDLVLASCNQLLNIYNEDQRSDCK